MAAICGANSVALCDACGFVSSRKPQKGRKHYCLKERKKIANRERQRAHDTLDHEWLRKFIEHRIWDRPR